MMKFRRCMTRRLSPSCGPETLDDDQDYNFGNASNRFFPKTWENSSWCTHTSWQHICHHIKSSSAIWRSSFGEQYRSMNSIRSSITLRGPNRKECLTMVLRYFVAQHFPSKLLSVQSSYDFRIETCHYINISSFIIRNAKNDDQADLSFLLYKKFFGCLLSNVGCGI
jgi:hypothetical protein